MSGGLTVAACVGVALALVETLWPRLLCAYVLWQQKRARAQSNAPSAVKVPVGDVERVERVEQIEETERSEGVEESERGEKVDEAGGKCDEAEKIWKSAREMIHSESPDFSTDWQYMTLVHKAAELGHLEAMSKLGDYAFKRGDVVEAFYWKFRVEMGGGHCRNPTLTDIVRVWTEVGCPDGSEDIGVRFPVQRADFAHAVLCLKSGVDPRFGAMRLKELSDAGDEDAMRFLKRR